MEHIQHHFSRIAPRYRQLRTTDSAPVLYIVPFIRHLPRIIAADFGCGTGRYPLKLFQYLGDRLFLYCIDNNREMLAQLQRYLKRHHIRNLRVLNHHAEDTILQEDSLDCVFTFNAIHHFRSEDFFSQASRILKKEGLLFIYTRFRSQNARNIWGRYFPGFSEKETRLYELHEMKQVIAGFPELEMIEIKYFRFPRVASIDWLLNRAQHHHYSTFSLYREEEFRVALEKFEENLKTHFDDLNRIHWVDENVMLVVRKRVWN